MHISHNAFVHVTTDGTPENTEYDLNFRPRDLLSINKLIMVGAVESLKRRGMFPETGMYLVSYRLKGGKAIIRFTSAS